MRPLREGWTVTEVLLRTRRLRLVLESPNEVRARLAGLSPEVRAQVSTEWLARVETASVSDPWLHGYVMVRVEDGATVGQCGFKGPPDAAGSVEIAYEVAPAERGRGYATEAARALALHAFEQGVQVVRAHTLCEPSASTRVLTKCGFEWVGEVVDPEDGPVWRWERRDSAPAD